MARLGWFAKFLAIFASLAVIQAIGAQNEHQFAEAKAQDLRPTLQETDHWLQQHLPVSFIWVGPLSTVYQNAQYKLNGCYIKVDIDSKEDHHDYTPTENTVYVVMIEGVADHSFGEYGHGIVNLRDVDLASIRVKAETIESLPISLGFRNFQVPFTDRDDAERMSNALRHAAILCGSKPLF